MLHECRTEIATPREIGVDWTPTPHNTMPSQITLSQLLETIRMQMQIVAFWRQFPSWPRIWSIWQPPALSRRSATNEDVSWLEESAIRAIIIKVRQYHLAGSNNLLIISDGWIDRSIYRYQIIKRRDNRRWPTSKSTTTTNSFTFQ